MTKVNDRPSRNDRDQILALLAAIGGAVGIPAAILAGRPISAILILLTLLAVPFAVNMHFRRRGKPRQGALGAIGFGVLVAVTVTPAMIVPQSRHYLLYELVGIAASQEVKIIQITTPKLLVTSSPQPSATPRVAQSRIRVVLQNPRQADVLVTELGLAAIHSSSDACGSSEYFRYEVNDRATVTHTHRNQTEFDGDVRELHGPSGSGRQFEPAVILPMTGSYDGMTCDLDRISLSLRVTAPLPATGLATMDIDVPEIIRLDGGLSVPMKLFAGDLTVSVTFSDSTKVHATCRAGDSGQQVCT